MLCRARTLVFTTETLRHRGGRRTTLNSQCVIQPLHRLRQRLQLALGNFLARATLPTRSYTEPQFQVRRCRGRGGQRRATSEVFRIALPSATPDLFDGHHAVMFFLFTDQPPCHATSVTGASHRPRHQTPPLLGSSLAFSNTGARLAVEKVCELNDAGYQSRSPAMFGSIY